MEEKLTKRVIPCGKFNASVYLGYGDIDNTYEISEEELSNLGKTLMWSSEEYEEEVPIYEERTKVVEEETPDFDSPIYENDEIVGYNLKPIKVEFTEQVEIGKKTITKTRPILVPYDNSHDLLIENARKELQDIKQWLCDNDWKVNKIVIGEWQQTDPRWVSYLEERAIKRNRQDYLNEVINNDQEN